MSVTGWKPVVDLREIQFLKRYAHLLSTFLVMAGGVSIAHAVPTLQVGAPAGTGDNGNFADYTGIAHESH